MDFEKELYIATEEASRSREQFVKLKEAFLEASRIEDDTNILQYLLSASGSMCKARQGLVAFSTKQPPPSDLVVAHVWPDGSGNGLALRPGTIVPLSAVILRKAAQLNQEVISSADFEQIIKRKGKDSLLEEHGLLDHHFIAVPIMAAQVRHGAMMLFKPSEEEEFPAEAGKVAFLFSTLVGTLLLYRQSFGQFVKTLASAVDKRDPYTAGHSSRVANFAALVAAKLKLPHDEIEKIRWAGYLHDIGKIGLSDDILTGEGDLSNIEFAEMKTHPSQARAILESVDGLKNVMMSAYYHHENFNGGGYPEGIPLSGNGADDRYIKWASILRIVDSYDAMVSDRAYRRGLPMALAMEEIREKKGAANSTDGWYDPEVVKAFEAAVESQPEKFAFDVDRENKHSQVMSKKLIEHDKLSDCKNPAVLISQVVSNATHPVIGALLIHIDAPLLLGYHKVFTYIMNSIALMLEHRKSLGRDIQCNSCLMNGHQYFENETSGVLCLSVSARSAKSLFSFSEQIKAEIKVLFDNGPRGNRLDMRLRSLLPNNPGNLTETDLPPELIKECESFLALRENVNHEIGKSKSFLKTNCGLAACHFNDDASKLPINEVAEEIVKRAHASLKTAIYYRPNDRANYCSEIIEYSL